VWNREKYYWEQSYHQEFPYLLEHEEVKVSVESGIYWSEFEGKLTMKLQAQQVDIQQKTHPFDKD
jgi:hypothetical protein